MGALTQSVIAALQTEDLTDKTGDLTRQAGDLLAKAHMVGYSSGFPDTDDEEITPEEADDLQRAVVAALERCSDSKTAGSLLWALGKSHDPNNRTIFNAALERYLNLLLDSNNAIFQCLIALDNMKAEVAEPGESMFSVTAVDDNIERARAILRKQGVTVPW